MLNDNILRLERANKRQLNNVCYITMVLIVDGNMFRTCESKWVFAEINSPLCD